MRSFLIVTLVAGVAGLSPAPSEAEYYFNASCQSSTCKKRVIAPHRDHLRAIAWCESRLQWHLDGQYDGGFQFNPGTWNATGSSYAFAWQAPPLEQKYRAVVWASRIGWAWHSTAGWPVCG